ncbi:MAG: acyltransferase, partial [Cytophagales bacterium]|nr:acyltransferase [Cytophagales bacterium]
MTKLPPRISLHEKQLRIEQLTFTRFVAAIVIVIYHYGNSYHIFQLPLISDIVHTAYIGVSYFFLLSGFILAVVYNKTDFGDTTNKLKFWIARIARIFPLYLASLVIYFLPSIFEGYWNVFISKRGFFHSVLLQAWIPAYALKWNFPAWSLSVEFFLYLSFPFLFGYIQNWSVKRLVTVALSFWFLTILSLAVLKHFIPYEDNSNTDIFIKFSPVFHLSTFFFGMAGGILFVNRPALKLQSNITYLFIATVLALLSLIVIKSGLHDYFQNGFLSPLFLLIILTLAWNKTGITKLLHHPVLVLLGEISFGIYILQEPVRVAYIWLTGNQVNENAIDFCLYLF